MIYTDLKFRFQDIVSSLRLPSLHYLRFEVLCLFVSTPAWQHQVISNKDFNQMIKTERVFLLSTISMAETTHRVEANVNIGPPPPAPKFHYFNHLPTELRQEILTLLKPEPRMVEIWHERRGGGKKQRPQPVPTPLLHVNQEIRAFALKWYTLILGPQLASIPWYGSGPRPALEPRRVAEDRPIYFDFTRDTLRMMNGDALTRLYDTQTSKVPESKLAHMADIEAKIRFLRVYNNFPSTKIGLVSRFHNLETLVANYDMKPRSEKLFVKQMTARAEKNGWELKIPRFKVVDVSSDTDADFRELRGKGKWNTWNS